MNYDNSNVKDIRLNLYMSGVGGQGIGVLSELLIRAYDAAGYNVKGVDTHGLAQRGGRVESHLRIGHPGGNPLIEAGTADIAICLERTEAFRAMLDYLRPGGTLIYFNTSWQTLQVRLGIEDEITTEMIRIEGEKRNTCIHEIPDTGLEDVRMQNMMLISAALNENLLEGLSRDAVESALSDLFSGDLLRKNIALLDCPI